MKYNKQCNQCGKTFISLSPKARFCSKKCARKHYYNRYKDKENKQAKRWYQRNKEYRKIYTYFYRAKNKKLFSFYKSKERYGGLREIILKRDKYKCIACGSQIRLVIHHLDGTNYRSGNANNVLNNLVTLCSSCHHFLHKEQGRTCKRFSREDIVRTLAKSKEAYQKVCPPRKRSIK